MEARLSGVKSRCFGDSYGGVLFGLRMECTIKTFDSPLLYAVLAQSGLLSEPQQIQGDSSLM